MGQSSYTMAGYTYIIVSEMIYNILYKSIGHLHDHQYNVNIKMKLSPHNIYLSLHIVKGSFLVLTLVLAVFNSWSYGYSCT